MNALARRLHPTAAAATSAAAILLASSRACAHGDLGALGGVGEVVTLLTSLMGAAGASLLAGLLVALGARQQPSPGRLRTSLVLNVVNAAFVALGLVLAGLTLVVLAGFGDFNIMLALCLAVGLPTLAIHGLSWWLYARARRKAAA